jgi:large subunit ribosomal protein L3
MIDTILAIKGKMSQTFIEGRRVPVTFVTAGPCVVTQIKTKENDGYWAIQLGLGTKKNKNTSKPLQGHLKKTIKDNSSPRFLAEVRFEKEPQKKDGTPFNIGEMVTLSDIFSIGDIISVSGISKGKGFAGGVKRWHFEGGPRTHGQSDRERAPGAISSGTTPGRVRKGKKMAGRMGSDKKTIKNLQIVNLDSTKNEIAISGPVPGTTGNLIIINRLSAGKLKGITEVQAQVVEGEAPEGEVKAEGEAQPETAAPKVEEKKEEVANA